MLERSLSADPISLIFSQLKLSVELSVNAQFCGDWWVGKKQQQRSFHLISHGDCQLSIGDERVENLSAGDIIIFVRATEHKIRPCHASEQPEQRCQPQARVNGPSTGMLCGYFAYQNRHSESLMASLPDYLLIKNTPNTQAWIEPILQLIHTENKAQRLGSDMMLAHFVESLVLHAVRSYFEQTKLETGLMALFSHPKLGQAVNAIHSAIEQNWTVELMAKACHMSRTSFATHFKQVSGKSPMEYLSWWRMLCAWDKLRQGQSVAVVAAAVGYRSEAAFARQFKKTFQTGPGEVRRY